VSEKISLVRCGDYRREVVEEKVAKALDLLGGVEAIAGKGASVFVKVNNVMAAAPETGIVSHPEVARAVVEQFKRVAGRIAIGDSPGGPFTPAMLKRVYQKTGTAAVARETGAEPALDTETVTVQLPDGRSIKRLTLCRSMLEADCLVSISKFKTHRYMNVTGPIKNLYGTVPGTTKFVYHSRFDDPKEFADLIVDVHLASKPAFHVLDAVHVTEGEGSRHGTIREMGCIMAGRNAFAMESLVTDLAGLSLDDNKVLTAAVARGACRAGTGWFEVLGDDPDGLRLENFLLPAANFFSERVPAIITERLSRLVAATPEPVEGACTLCRKCAEVCPRGAITMGEKVAVVDASKCIRCFCCDELCEQQAIGMKVPLLMRLKRA
jgi:uncharacterized protein (DUF362 family)/Pyruvate/2-oxoacid:ferredoxin oxidoreductase delta subunit